MDYQMNSLFNFSTFRMLLHDFNNLLKYYQGLSVGLCNDVGDASLSPRRVRGIYNITW